MISTFLAEHPWTIWMVLAGMVVVGSFAASWLDSRRRLTRVLLAASLLLVVALTLLPDDREVTTGCQIAWSLPTFSGPESLANITLFIPFALLAAVAWRRPWLAGLAGVGLSMGIETAQALLPSIGRSCDSQDIIANSIGAALGAVLAAIGMSSRIRRSAQIRTNRA